MKQFITVILILSAVTTFADEMPFFSEVDQFMGKYVQQGHVDYTAIKNNPKSLDNLVDALAHFSLEGLSDNQQLAFWINAYNILVIHRVVQHYPITSVQEIGGFFDVKKANINGQKLTLDEIENTILRPRFKDSRIHYVLVCGAVGCPIIIPEAYKPVTLDDQMTKRFRKTVNDDHFVKVDHEHKKVQLSEIFRWYGKDFLMDHDTIIDYLNTNHVGVIPREYKIEYKTYDWTLNDLKKTASDTTEQLSVQNYTPSTLLASGQFELKFFNNLYTQTDYFDDQQDRIKGTTRSTYNTAILTLQYGISRRLNIGIDAYYKSVRIDDTSDSALAVFSFESDDEAHSGLTYLGPALKISPFSQLSSLAFKTSYLFSVATDPEGEEHNHPFLDYEDDQIWIQLFYDQKLGNDWLIYYEVDGFIRLEPDETGLTTPVKAIINYYPSSKWTLYLPLEYGPGWSDGSVASFYTQVGLGGKYQLLPNLEIELLYTIFPIGKESGAGETYNLGLRFIY